MLKNNYDEPELCEPKNVGSKIRKKVHIILVHQFNDKCSCFLKIPFTRIDLEARLGHFSQM